MDLADLNETREYETPQEGDDCPECVDGKMVLRVKKNWAIDETPDVNNGFLGCSNFPHCRFTQNL